MKPKDVGIGLIVIEMTVVLWRTLWKKCVNMKKLFMQLLVNPKADGITLFPMTDIVINGYWLLKRPAQYYYYYCIILLLIDYESNDGQWLLLLMKLLKWPSWGQTMDMLMKNDQLDSIKTNMINESQPDNDGQTN